MLAGMGLLLDSFWRATAYCLHKRVIAWSLFPLLFMAITAWLLGYFFWADAVVWTEGVLQGVGWLHTVWSWMGVQSLPELVAPVLVVLSVTPVLVVVSLLLVALFMTPALVELVAQRRFPALERRQGATLIGNGPDALTRVSMIGNDMALDSGVGTCGKDGQSVPVGVGQPTLRIDGLTVGGTA